NPNKTMDAVKRPIEKKRIDCFILIYELLTSIIFAVKLFVYHEYQDRFALQYHHWNIHVDVNDILFELKVVYFYELVEDSSCMYQQHFLLATLLLIFLFFSSFDPCL